MRRRDNPTQALRLQLERFARSDLFYAEDVDFEELLETYIVLNETSKRIEKRLEALKTVLHQAAKARGSETETGNLELRGAGHHLVRERRVSREPDPNLVRALLETKNIELRQAFDSVQTLVLNPSKLRHLVDTGFVAEADLEALRKETFAIKAEGSKQLQRLLREIFEGYSMPEGAENS